MIAEVVVVSVTASYVASIWLADRVLKRQYKVEYQDDPDGRRQARVAELRKQRDAFDQARFEAEMKGHTTADGYRKHAKQCDDEIRRLNEGGDCP